MSDSIDYNLLKQFALAGLLQYCQPRTEIKITEDLSTGKKTKTTEIKPAESWAIRAALQLAYTEGIDRPQTVDFNFTEIEPDDNIFKNIKRIPSKEGN